MNTLFFSDIYTEPKITNIQLETSTQTSYKGERPFWRHVPNQFAYSVYLSIIVKIIALNFQAMLFRSSTLQTFFISTTFVFTYCITILQRGESLNEPVHGISNNMVCGIRAV